MPLLIAFLKAAWAALRSLLMLELFELPSGLSFESFFYTIVCDERMGGGLVICEDITGIDKV